MYIIYVYIYVCMHIHVQVDFKVESGSIYRCRAPEFMLVYWILRANGFVATMQDYNENGRGVSEPFFVAFVVIIAVRTS